MKMNRATDAMPLPAEQERAARQLAKRLIYLYVERGDSFFDLKASHMGMAGPPGYSAQIGGWMDGKAWTTDFIIVSKVDGYEVNRVFRLRDIYREVEGEIMSATALEDFRLEPG